MIKMSRLVASAALTVASWSTVTFAQTLCPGGNGPGPYYLERDGLDWCSTNNGFNEGATCGLHALTGTNVSLPADAGQAILGNLWNRTNMMGAAKAAFKGRMSKQAVDAAICCQIHNEHMHACMERNRPAIEAWLRAHS